MKTRMVKKPIRTNIQINATALTAAAQPSADSRSARSTQAKRPTLPDSDTNTAPQHRTRSPAPHITGRSAPDCPAAQHAPPGQQ